MKLIPWLVILSLGLVSCSGSKSAQRVNEEPPQIELSDADEFIENPGDAPLDADALDLTSDVTSETNFDGMDSTEFTSNIAMEDDSPVIMDQSTPQVAMSTGVDAGTMMEYRVQKNETLMMIAFKLYGDYSKWKTLAAQNRGVLNNGHNVREGMTLMYPAPAQAFVWNPQGLPYLIRTGDTLMGISQNVYTTTKKWKLIWDNNRPLIKDPNRIFSGFTIYYLENGREVASEI